MQEHNLKTHIENLFKNTKFSDENNNIFVNKIFEAIEKIDNEFVEILLADDTAKKTFFSKIKDTYVMNQFKLIDFFSMNNYFEESYTSYTNKIGLIRKDDFIKKNNDVVLAFPYKDCVLEGGQTKDDEKGKENFFNEILDSDEIDRLFEPKVLTSIKRYSKDGVEDNPTISDKDNLILKGNNLLALHSLKKKYAGKIKLIYIDPPYNTGNDSFKYNDNFNHSTWLTFMKNRLEVARELLRDDGVIFIQCDDNEQAYLKVLMDEVFYNENLINTICVKMSHLSGVKMSHSNKKLPKIKEYVHVYSKTSNINISPVFIKANWKSVLERYKSFLVVDEEAPNDISKWKVRSLNNMFALNNISSDDQKNDFVIKNAKYIFRTARNKSKQIENLPNDNIFRLIKTSTGLEKYIYKKEEVLFASSKLVNNEFVETIGDIWTDIGINNLHNEGGVDLSNGKKPEKLLKRIIEMSTEPNDMVLDFHLGSGTTCAVAHKMGRQYIGIEQMDYIQDITVERIKKVIDGEQGGISKSVDWKGGGDFVYAELKQVSNFDKSNSRLKQEMQYLPIGELEDEDYKISKEEIAINKAFYGVDDE